MEIEHEDFNDFELYDLPGFITNEVDPTGAVNQELQIAARKIREINQKYVRNTDFQIVLLIRAGTDGQGATGLTCGGALQGK